MTERFRNPGEFVREELQDQFERTRSLLAGSPEEAAERMLERFGAEPETATQIAADLADLRPLAAPERFAEAHRATMRALEVLDREGSHDPRVPGLGPLTPLAQKAVAFVTEYIVKSYVKEVAERLRKLYAQREAQCPPELPERRMLGRARVEVGRLVSEYGGPGGLALLAAAGALVPLLGAASQRVGALPFDSAWVRFLGIALAFVVFFGLSWVLLRGAGVAHRRARVIMQPSLAALWQTIGHCGNPPEDDSTMYATVAIILTAVIWFVLPGLIAAAFVL